MIKRSKKSIRNNIRRRVTTSSWRDESRNHNKDKKNKIITVNSIRSEEQEIVKEYLNEITEKE